MKRKIFGIIVCTLLIIPALSMSAVADPSAKLHIQIFGGLPLPPFIHYVGGAIANLGDTTAYNISYILTVTGGTSGNINITVEGYYEKIKRGYGLGVVTPNAYGFGPVTITLTASASNADSVTVKAKGFQIGDFTWVPLSWIIPPIFKGLFPWLNCE